MGDTLRDKFNLKKEGCTGRRCLRPREQVLLFHLSDYKWLNCEKTVKRCPAKKLEFYLSVLIATHNFVTMYRSYLKQKTPICMCSIIHAIRTINAYLSSSLCSVFRKTKQIINAGVRSAGPLKKRAAFWIYFRLIIRGSRFMFPKWRARYELFKCAVWSRRPLFFYASSERIWLRGSDRNEKTHTPRGKDKGYNQHIVWLAVLKCAFL